MKIILKALGLAILTFIGAYLFVWALIAAGVIN